MKEFICFHNGEYKKESKVSISFRDLGFQRAYGVFDYLRTYKHKPFQENWHRNKLLNSLREMKIHIDEDAFDYLKTVNTLLNKNKYLLKEDREYGIKTIITGGVDGIPTVLMYLEGLNDSRYRLFQEKGVALLAKKAPRQIPSVKNIDYKILLSAQKELEEKKCLEILHRCDKYVYESGTSNFFIIKDNKVITPAEGIYKGSTREFVINLINRENSILFEERYILWNELLEADEVFITASKKEILPVIKIFDENNILYFDIGNTTKKLIKLFHEKLI